MWSDATKYFLCSELAHVMTSRYILNWINKTQLLATWSTIICDSFIIKYCLLYDTHLDRSGHTFSDRRFFKMIFHNYLNIDMICDMLWQHFLNIFWLMCLLIIIDWDYRFKYILIFNSGLTKHFHNIFSI